MKIKTICSIVLAVILLSGCQQDQVATNSETTQKERPTQNVSSQGKQILTYDQYRLLFADMSKRLTLPNSEQIEKTDHTELIAIDKSDSFGTRSVLTLDGEQSDKETQERIIYKDVSNGVITLVDLLYLKAYIGNDMVYLQSHSTETSKNEPAMKKFEECILSYRNLLVKITMVSNDQEISLEQMTKSIKAVTSYLQSYKI